MKLILLDTCMLFEDFIFEFHKLWNRAKGVNSYSEFYWILVNKVEESTEYQYDLDI